MGDKYVVTGSQDVTTATPGDTSQNLFNPGTTKRGWVFDWVISTGGTPADNAIQWLVRKSTAVGTEGAGVVPLPTDGGAASILDGSENHSAEPTYTAASELFDQIINQRATFRWVAAPGAAWVIPASTSNGIGWCCFHASYAGSAEATVYFEE